MKLKEMFDKDIERDIKGVIKIGQDDDANVFQELDEYVVTRELSRHFSTFFEVYQSSIDDYTDKMGVWISGFFGSGKSHFLKILSYLLANKEVQGKKAISYFDDKIEDPIVLADMERAGDVSTDVILFNIDSKSDTDSKTNKESIVRVFNKVFDRCRAFVVRCPGWPNWNVSCKKKAPMKLSKTNMQSWPGSPGWSPGKIIILKKTIL